MTMPLLLTLVMLGAVAVLLSLVLDGGPSSDLVQRARALNAGGTVRKARRVQERSLRRAGDSRLDELVQRFLPRPAVLRQRLEATGLPLTLGHYGVACGGAGLAFMGGAFLMHAPVALALLEGLASGLLIPHASVGFLMRRRRARFFKLFPEAIALMVRGLRAGLPVSESISVVGRELGDPVGEEFRRICDQVRLGMGLEEAMWQTAGRLGLAEFNFLVISLSVQRETGGNLAETLENLESIIRRRHQMRLKIKAMSAEATAAAMIIGALPFVTAALMYMVNRGYLVVLFTTPLGHLMVIAGLFSLFVGILVMRGMIRFEI